MWAVFCRLGFFVLVGRMLHWPHGVRRADSRRGLAYAFIGYR